MICDFLASFTRREKRPHPGRGHTSEPHPHRDHVQTGSAPDSVPAPARRETLP